MYSRKDRCFVKTVWKKIKVGDVVKVGENEFFPADMIMLDSTED